MDIYAVQYSLDAPIYSQHGSVPFGGGPTLGYYNIVSPNSFLLWREDLTVRLPKPSRSLAR
jgi:hypothetical protein